MNAWKKGIVALLLFAAAGCVPTQRELRMEEDLQELKRRLSELERGMAAVREDREGRERLSALAQQQAELQAGFDTLRVEFQSVSGRFEDQARAREQLRDDLALLRDDLGLKLTAAEDRLARIEERQGKLEEEAKAKPAVPESPETLYGRGLELVQKGDFAGGRKWLEEFLQRYPQNELAPNARYWVGESWYGEKSYESAILQFQEVVQKHPDHPKAASALLKQGMAFQALGDRKNARVVWQKLIERFPAAEEAKRARERLAELGKP